MVIKKSNAFGFELVSQLPHVKSVESIKSKVEESCWQPTTASSVNQEPKRKSLI